MESSISIYKK